MKMIFLLLALLPICAVAQTEPHVDYGKIGNTVNLTWVVSSQVAGSYYVEHSQSLGTNANWARTRLSRISIQRQQGTNYHYSIDVEDVPLTMFFRVRHTTEYTFEAETVILSRVDFPSGSSVAIKSLLAVLAPRPNTVAFPAPGHVNFIVNVRYDGQPAQDYIGHKISIDTLP